MRTKLPEDLQAKVFVRDHWTCRYCGVEVLFSPALKALEALSPRGGRGGIRCTDCPVYLWSISLLKRCIHAVAINCKNEEAIFQFG